jgi:Putative prokaryotic signal transducing protein
VRELVRTSDAVVISAIEALLKSARIAHMIVDQNMSVLEGSIGIFPRRILVDTDQLAAARRLLVDAGLGHELRQDGR